MFLNETPSVIQKARAKPKSNGVQKDLQQIALTPNPDDAEAMLFSLNSLREDIEGDDEALWKPLASGNFQSSLYTGLLPKVDDIATNFFVSNYVVHLDSAGGPLQGYTNFWGDTMDDALAGSVKAIGLAGLATLSGAPDLLEAARTRYTKAIRLTNAALQSPTEVKKDSTLLSVMILGNFEAIAGNDRQSLVSWANHIDGAAALIGLRGRKQLFSADGRRLFIQVTSALVTSCLQRSKPVPKHIKDLREEAAKHVYDPTDPAWRIQDAMFKFTDLHAHTDHGLISDPEEILAKALEIEETIHSCTDGSRLYWQWETVYTDKDPDIVFAGYYHVYKSYGAAQTWNGIRAIRLMLHEMIRKTIIYGMTSPSNPFADPKYHQLLQKSIDTEFQMHADILASVPQHLGYPFRYPVSKPEHQTTDAFLWSAFEEVKMNSQQSERTSISDQYTPFVRASGSYLLPWALYLTGVWEYARPQVRDWIVNVLRVVGQQTGIQQATLLANIMDEMKVAGHAASVSGPTHLHKKLGEDKQTAMPTTPVLS
ncbi:hypothetical protein H2203_003129 [Taxawa tesnikishii (nom. ined.)]|nr:hypothetical protein H2203_003129 [Dothideales sp. JES 119]